MQLIHNAPLPGSGGGPAVDVYVNGVLSAGTTDLRFRQATAFLAFPAGTAVSVELRASPSDPSDTPIGTYDLGTLEADEYYTATILGVPGGIPGLPPLTMVVNANARSSSPDGDLVSFNGIHGAVLVPPVSVHDRVEGHLTDLTYGQYAPYAFISPGLHYLDVWVTGLDFPITFEADLTGLAGQSMTLVTSGVALGNPEQGIFGVLADGTVLAFEPKSIASVQVIHNSASPTVDIYIDGALVLNDLAFRTATPYIFLPADRVLDVAIAPANSTSAADAFDHLSASFENGGTYSMVLNGIVASAEYPLTLAVAPAREVSSDNELMEAMMFHGSPFTPDLDIRAKEAGNIYLGLAYNTFSDYAPFNQAVFYIDLKEAGTQRIIASYILDVDALLLGQSITLVASGFLDESPELELLAVHADGTILSLEQLHYARVQLFNNSADQTVDLYVNSERTLNNFAYRQGTPYLDIPAGIPVRIYAGPENSGSTDDAFFSRDFNLDRDSAYLMILSGLPGDDDHPFHMDVYDRARELASADTITELIAYHGALGAPDLDIDNRAGGTIFSGLTYDEFDGYLRLDPAVYLLDVRATGDNDVLFTYEADLAAQAGRTATLIASGTFGGEPSFALLALWNDGTVVPLPGRSFSPVQFINNAPAGTYDIYVNGVRWADDLAFRKATAFADLESNESYDIAIATAVSQSADDAFLTYEGVTLESGKDYVMVLGGIPGDDDFPFTLFINDQARAQADQPATVDIAAFHGAPESPDFDVDLRGGGAMFTDVTYGFFAPYVSSAPIVSFLELKAAGEEDVLGTYELDMRAFSGQSATILFSGLQGEEPEFALLAAFSDGTVQLLPQRSFTRVQLINNAPSETLDIYIDNELVVDDLDFHTATGFMDMAAERLIQLAIAPGDSDSADDAYITYFYLLDDAKTHVMTITGILGDDDFPMEIYVNEFGKETAVSATALDASVFHGSPITANLDISLRGSGLLAQNLAYGYYEPYDTIVPAVYFLDLKFSSNASAAGTYYADMTDMGGYTGTIFTSGIFGSTPPLSVFVALSDGRVIEFPAIQFGKVQLLHNAPSDAVDLYLDNTRIADDFAYRSGTPFIELPAGLPQRIAVAPANSQSVSDTIISFTFTLQGGQNHTLVLNGVNQAYDADLLGGARTGAANPAQVDLRAYNGGSGLSAIDVRARYSAVLGSNLAYGAAADYTSLSPNRYLLDVRSAGSNQIFGTFEGQLAGLEGRAGLLFTTLLPAAHPSEVTLAILLDNGEVIELPASAAGHVQLIHNAVGGAVDVYVEQAKVLDDFAYRTATTYLEVPAFDIPVNVGIAPANSQSAADVILNYPLLIENGREYVAIAYGVPGSVQEPLTVAIYNNARSVSANNLADVLTFNGAGNTSSLDVFVAGTPILGGLEYGDFEDYLNIPPGVYDLDVRTSGAGEGLGIFRGDLTDFGGQSLTLFASGIAGGQPDFGIWAALANGITFPLEIITSVDGQLPGLTALTLSPNPASDRVRVELELNTPMPTARMELVDIHGRVLRSEALRQLPAGRTTLEITTGDLLPGVYRVRIQSADGQVSRALVVTGRQ